MPVAGKRASGCSLKKFDGDRKQRKRNSHFLGSVRRQRIRFFPPQEGTDFLKISKFNNVL